MYLKFNLRLTMALLSIIMLAGCAVEPVAFFSMPANAGYNTPVKFTNYSVDADSYLWEFGDGTTSTEKEPAHIYTTPGNYTIKLTAYSKGGKKQDSRSKSIVIDAISGFVGNYLVTQSCTNGNTSYVFSIFSNGVNLFISSLDMQAANFVCEANGTSISMFPQFLNGFEYSGSGTLNGDVLTFDFTKNDGVSPISCTITAIKQ